jgi:hypothetical protein
MDEKNSLGKSPEQIQLALAEKRLSLRESLIYIEGEAEKRVMATMDHVQQRITEASDEISRTLTKPFHSVQEKLQKVPDTLRSKPIQTLLATAALGAGLGFAAGRRSKRRYQMQLALPASGNPYQEALSVHSRQKALASRGFWSSIVVEASRQILLNALMSLTRRQK